MSEPKSTRKVGEILRLRLACCQELRAIAMSVGGSGLAVHRHIERAKPVNLHDWAVVNDGLDLWTGPASISQPRQAHGAAGAASRWRSGNVAPGALGCDLRVLTRRLQDVARRRIGEKPRKKHQRCSRCSWHTYCRCSVHAGNC
jgi:hypothetical protein